MDPVIERIQEEFLLIGRYLTAVTKHPDQLERSAITLLACLRAGRAMSIGELAAALGLDDSTVNRQTAPLLARGLLERIPDPAGGIARKLRLTALGSERIGTEFALNHDVMRQLLVDWEPEEIAGFAHALERFNTAIEQRSGRHWPRGDAGDASGVSGDAADAG